MSMIGKALGTFTLKAQIGKGGMGEVYRAKDQKLGRDVAIKVLPEEFAKDADRVARFQREAKLLASLNHPNIAAIYGLEESNGTHFLVLELIEGDTLADRIKRGPVPVEESLKLALQIAEALEAAHEKGVIHRDLKPANIKVTPDGNVKVLDFGLAKAFAGDSEDMNLSNSPTLSVAATQQGVILGTAAYMSPEQARGKQVDKRTDIWAFGCVLFEMLTGQQTWTGDTVTDIIAAALAKDPDFSILPASIHSDVKKLLRRCLKKDPKKRLRDAADAAIEIEEALVASISSETGSAKPPIRRWRLELLFGTIILAIGLIAGWIVGILKAPERVAVSPVAQLAVVMPPETELLLTPGNFPLNMALSQDGRWIAFVAQKSAEEMQLYLRSIDNSEVHAIPGSENARLPFFSPDGKWVAYYMNNALFKASVDGLVPLKIGDLPFGPRGAAWGENEAIYLGGANRGLYRISANGGEAVEVTKPNLDQGEQYHAWPDALPDGKNVLFTSVRADGYSIGVLSLKTGECHILEQTEGAGQPHYLNSGHLVFFRKGGLFAAPFDSSLIALAGPDALVQEDVSWRFDAGLDLGYFSVSRSGSLLYLPASGTEEQSRLVMVDRSGNEEELPTPIGRYYGSLSFSPDMKQITYDFIQRKAVDIWTFDIERGTENRLTFQDDNIGPTWSSDGTQIVFSKFKRGVPSFDLYWAPADGSGRPEPLLLKGNDQFGADFSPDGRLIAFVESNPKTGYDIHILHLDEERSATPFIATPSNEEDPVFSPDGRFLAYTSDRTGRSEIYVQPLSGNKNITTISNDGGSAPEWSPRGDEIFYRSGDKMMAAKVLSTSPSFSAEKSQEIFQGSYGPYFDVAADGKHFLMLKPSKRPPISQIQVVLNWFEELKERVPVN
jgi:serine/threonine protein kinase/Tol biopolymer transport system component